MRKTVITCSALSLLILSGCALGPDYQRPSNLTPNSYRGASSEAADVANTLSDMPWWTIYRDPQLQELITIALSDNPDLKLMAARVEEAQAFLGVVSSELWPQVGAQISASRERTPDTFRSVSIPPSVENPEGVYAPARNNVYSALLYSSYELDLWGRIRRSKESAIENLLATEADRRVVVSSLVTEVARNYFSLLELDREIEITSATLDARLQTLELMRLRQEHGIASDLEVKRYVAEVAATRAILAGLKQQAYEMENALSVLLGRSPKDIRRGWTFAEQPPIPDIPVGVPAQILERRPDLQAAEHQLAAATAQIGVAKAAFFPRIALTGEYGYRSSELDTLLRSNSHGWLIAGNMVQSIFSGGRNWFNLKATRARQEQALQNYRASILQALREVSDALIARRQTREQRLELKKQADALNEAVRLATLRYQAGESSYLELLDTQQQLYAAELQLERARLNEILSTVRLYKNLGGGYDEKIFESDPMITAASR